MINRSSKQLTEKEAITLYESKEWQNWSHRELFEFQITQERLCVPFKYFHECTEKTLGKEVYTHEFAFKDKLYVEYLNIITTKL
jgi:hypothetical protein